MIRRGVGRWWLALLLLALAGCASAPKPTVPPDAVNGPWSGRLALQVEDRPGESFTAGFELKGNAVSGELMLYSPLGGTLAALSWRPGVAMLRSNGDTRQFPSVETLIGHVAGAPFPVGALFDWLQGIDSSVPGWRADLTQLAQGRLTASRFDPMPRADLRVVLER